MKRLTFIIILLFMLISFFYNCTYVLGYNQDDSIVNQGGEWINRGKNESEDIPGGGTGFWNILAGMLTAIGIWVSIISGAILGIKFMISSPDQKADLKKSLMVWLIGVIVIMGALTIWKTLINILDIY